MKTILKTAERELLDPGFRRAYTPTAKPGDLPLIPTGSGRLARLKKGDHIQSRSVSVRQVVTIPPVMSEAALIRALQTHGIGRPSTYAATIETLVERGYATRSPKGELASTPRGQAACAYLLERFPAIFALDFTARMESQLDALAKEQAEYLDVLQSFWVLLQTDLDKK